MSGKDYGNYLKVGDRLKQARKQAGYTQKAFAQKLNIPVSTYSNYENGNRLPNITVLQRLAKYLQISETELMGLKPLMTDTETKAINDDIRKIVFCNYLSQIGFVYQENFEDLSAYMDGKLSYDQVSAQIVDTRENVAYKLFEKDIDNLEEHVSLYVQYLISMMLPKLERKPWVNDSFAVTDTDPCPPKELLESNKEK